MVAGMVAPGRLFLVADLPSVRTDDDTPCTQTPAPSSRGPNRIRSYVLDASEFTKPLDAVVLAELGDALHGLAACGSGAAVLYRAGDINYLSANGYLGRWDKAGEPVRHGSRTRSGRNTDRGSGESDHCRGRRGDQGADSTDRPGAPDTTCLQLGQRALNTIRRPGVDGRTDDEWRGIPDVRWSSSPTVRGA